MNHLFQKIKPRGVRGWLRTLAYALPVLALLIVLYLNYLPFGYDRTFVIQAGVAGDRDGQFRLISARDGLSERLTAADGTPYREISGASYAVFSPRAYLRDARVHITIDGDNIVMLPPNIAFDPAAYAWDTASTAGTDSCIAIPDPRSEALAAALPQSRDEAFSFYAEWTPQADASGLGLLAGTSSLGIVQTRDDVRFTVGSTTLKHPVDRDEFFGVRHAVLAAYAPGTAEQPSARIDLFVDGDFAGRIYFDAEQGPSAPPTAEGTPAPYYGGCLHDLRLRSEAIDTASTQADFTVSRDDTYYPLTLLHTGPGAGILRSITLHAVQD
jgi:hypothetical protein